MYGYDITRKVEEMTEGKIKLTYGALYPVLHKLENEGVKPPGTDQRKRFPRDHVGEKAQLYAHIAKGMQGDDPSGKQYLEKEKENGSKQKRGVQFIKPVQDEWSVTGLALPVREREPVSADDHKGLHAIVPEEVKKNMEKLERVRFDKEETP